MSFRRADIPQRHLDHFMFTLSHACILSTNMAYELCPFYRMLCNIVFKESTTYENPTFRVAPNFIRYPLVARNLWSLMFKTMLIILDVTSNKLMPHWLLRSCESPLFEIGTNLHFIECYATSSTSIQAFTKLHTTHLFSSSNVFSVFGKIPLIPCSLCQFNFSMDCLNSKNSRDLAMS